MFYSHEILTSRKYGVATVWLVATIGSKSQSKKIGRKQILNVDVPMACETITHPEAPMALRLQSNLLYGVSRVYSKQCDYVLGDAQNAQNNMRALLKIVRSKDIDLEDGKTRPDQLVLPDDPAFIPEFDIPQLDFEVPIFDPLSSQRDSQLTMLSPNSRSRSGSGSQNSLVGLLIPSSGSSMSPYQLPVHDPFAISGSSAQKGVGVKDIFGDEEGLLDDLDFDIDANGQIVDISAIERKRRRTASASRAGRLDSDSAASGRVRREHEEALARDATRIFDDDDGLNLVMDDDLVLPDAEAFASITAGATAKHGRLDSGPESSESPSSDTAEAPMKKRKTKPLKKLTSDVQTSLPNSVLATWQRDYTDNMAAVTAKKESKRAHIQAKKSAYTLTWGNGLGNVGKGIGASKLPRPLDVYSGEALLETILGTAFVKTKSNKRSHIPSGNDTDSETRRVRSRQDVEDQIGRGDDDPIVFQDDDLEIGREAQPDLGDWPSSAMPWNSASVGRGRSSSLQLPGSAHPSSLLGKHGRSRLTSASPLVGKGRVSDIERLSDLDLPEDEAIIHQFLSESQKDDFDIFGPAAAIGTQDIDSQWMAKIMNQESLNFLEYVKESIGKTGNDDDEDELAGDGVGGDVDFDTLFPPDEHSTIVASQAFYHVLSLATLNLLKVSQEGVFDGSIRMSVVKESDDVFT